MKFINKIKKENILVLFLFILAFFFQIYPFRKLMIKGIYSQAFFNTRVWLGFIEVILYSFLLISISFFSKKKNTFLVIGILVLVIFSQINNVLIPIFMGVLYFEILMLWGKFVNEVLNLKLKMYRREKVYEFIFGMLLWMFITIILSLFKFGKIEILLIMTILISIVIVLYLRKKNKLTSPLIITIFEKMFYYKSKEKFLIFILILLVFIQISKSRVVLEFDSIWYGLRSEYTLVGEKSFYDNLGLVQFVHYYPKFQEILYLPLSKTEGNYSFIYSANIYMYVIIIYFTYIFLDNFRITKINKLLLLTLIFSLPAISNYAFVAKTDLMTLFFLIFIIDNILIFYRIGKIEFLIFSILGMLISTGLKATFLMNLPFILIMLVIVLYIKRKNLFLKKENRLPCIILIFLTVFVTFGVHLRTYLLTGYPLYPFFPNIFKKLGFKAKYPFNLVEINVFKNGILIFNIKKILKKFQKIFFNPGYPNFGHLVMAWFGNFILYLYILIFLFKKKIKFNKIFLMLIPLNFSFFIWSYYLRNKFLDGNYFMFSMVIGISSLYTVFIKSLNFENVKKWNCIFFIFIPFQVFYSFIAHPSWSVFGIGETNFSIIKPKMNILNYNQINFNYCGLENVISYIRNNNIKRAMGYSECGNTILFRLPLTIEDFELSSHNMVGIKKLFSDKKSFDKYSKFSKIEILIISNDISKIKDVQIRNFIENYIRDKEIIQIDTYKIVKINSGGIK